MTKTNGGTDDNQNGGVSVEIVSVDVRPERDSAVAYSAVVTTPHLTLSHI